MNETSLQTPTLYPIWDMTLSELPPRSRLHRLLPIGIGTPEVESLTSYVMRLASAHGVDTNTIFAQEMAPLMTFAYLFKSDAQPVERALNLVKILHTVNGLGPVSLQWAHSLKLLTLQDTMDWLTMRSWKNLVSPLSLMRKMRAWCPDCLAENGDRPGPVYERLIWTLRPISVCIRHQRLLQEKCPYCDRSSPVLTVRSRPGHCFRCDRWLGSDDRTSPQEENQPGEELRRQVQKAKLIGEMLTLPPERRLLMTQRDFADLLNRHIQQITDGNAGAFARFLGLDDLVVRSMRYGVKHPCLESFITLILRLQMSVKDFMDGKKSEIELPSRHEFQILPSTSKARELIQAALSDPACPSVSELASSLGYKRDRNFRNADRELCKEISARHRRARTRDYRAPIHRYDDQTLREKLTAALQENPPPPVQQIAERLNYTRAATLKVRCPDLYFALMERRRVYLNEWKEPVKKMLLLVLTEEPAPSLRAAIQRLGLKSKEIVTYQFPELAKAIADRHREYIKARREQIKLALEDALTESPPPSVQQIARNVRFDISSLYRHCRELCHQVAANRLEYLRQHTLAQMEDRKAKIKQAILDLNAQGIEPSSNCVARIAFSHDSLRREWEYKYYNEVLSEIRSKA